MPETVAALIARADAGLASLTAIGESIEDEWQYVADLTAVWRGRLRAIADQRGATAVQPVTAVAVEHALAEIARITDPHRAIDWLSTFPQLVLLALDEEDRMAPTRPATG